MKRWVLIASLAMAAAVLLAGCGLKGPLYLPEKPAQPPQPDQGR